MGDTFHFHKTFDATEEAKEIAAAREIFSSLPESQREEFFDLVREFEARETPEAKFAASMDRLLPVLVNSAAGGGSWREHKLSQELVKEKNSQAADGSITIWAWMRSAIETTFSTM